MTTKRVLGVGLMALVVSACASAPPKPPTTQPPPVHQPPPATPPPTAGMFTFDTVVCSRAPHDGHCDTPILGATIKVHTCAPPSVKCPTGDTYDIQTSNAQGYNLWNEPDSLPDTDITILAPGYLFWVQGFATKDLVGQHNILQVYPVFPPAPTRDQVTNVCLSFQGLFVDGQQFGHEPYFEASLAWHDLPQDRQNIYAAKHASKNLFCPNGDTHAIIHIPFGPPLYDEAGQFYTADKFGPRDWTNGLTGMDPKFVNLVMEVRQAGFIPIITACGDGSRPQDYQCAMTQTPLILNALAHAPPRDLRMDVGLLPGYDGVFYGWGKNDAQTRQQITSWPILIRQTCPNCIVGIEHGTGKIPIGEGPSDWEPCGDMQHFDFLLSEFNDDLFDDSVWQIAARTIGPAYVRPKEQQSGDDSGSPFGIDKPQFYLRYAGPRGPIRACAFEFSTYGWVRGWWTVDHVQNVQRAYFKRVGYTCGG